MNNVLNNKSIFMDKLYRCPLCDSEKISFWLNKSKNGIQFDIYKCKECASGFMNPQPTEEYLSLIYATSGKGLLQPLSFEQVMEAEVEYPNATVDAKRLISLAQKLILSNGDAELNALDIGSGWGFFSKEAIDQGCKVTAINPGSWENNVFVQLNGFSPIPSFFEAVDFGDQKFDLVILSQVLEHIPDPLKLLQMIIKLLKQGGILTIAVPNVDSILVKILKDKDNSCLWVPEHLIYFSKRGLFALLERAGFTIKHHMYVSRIPYFIVSNKLKLKGTIRHTMNNIVKISQWLPFKFINMVGIGMQHNIWAAPIDLSKIH